MTAPKDVAEIVARIVTDVAELPDRTSPDGWPEAMLVTADELRGIVEQHITDLSGRLAEARRFENRICDGCGASMSEDAIRLMGAKSCCPERKMLSAQEWHDRALSAEAEVGRLLGLLQWCRPRLQRTQYQFTLDRYVAEATPPDHTPIVRSAAVTRGSGGSNDAPG